MRRIALVAALVLAVGFAAWAGRVRGQAPNPTPAEPTLPSAPVPGPSPTTSALPPEVRWGPPPGAVPPPPPAETPKPAPNPAPAATSVMPVPAAPVAPSSVVGTCPLPGALPATVPALPPPAPLDGTPSATPATAGMQAPIISLEKIGPATLASGKPLSYEIVARNNGAAPVADVRVDEELPAGAKLLATDPAPETPGERPRWNLGVLAPGAERRIKVTLQPPAEGDCTSRSTATFSLCAGLVTHVTRPRLTLSMAGPQMAQVGESVVFQIQVSNTGTGPANNVVLHDHLPAGLHHDQGSRIDADIGTLAPGQTRSVTLVATATSCGPQTDEAFVTAEDAAQAGAQALVSVTQPALALKHSAPQKRFLNRPAELALELTNPGTGPARNVHLTDALPPGLEFASASDGGVYDAAVRTVAWSVGALPAGEKRVFHVHVVAKAAGDWSSKAGAQGERGLEAKAEAGLHVEGSPALVLEVSDQDDPIEVGAETTYQIRIVNQGTSPSTGVQIVASIPEGMAPRDASGPTSHAVAGQEITFAKLPQLAPGAEAVYRVKVLGQKPGDLRFHVRLAADHLSQPVCEEESTRVYGD